MDKNKFRPVISPLKIARAAALLGIGLLLTSVFAQPAAPVGQKIDGATPLEWSERLATSEMKRIGSGYEFGGSNPRARWDYSPAVFALSLMSLGAVTGNEAYPQFGTRAFALDRSGRRGYFQAASPDRVGHTINCFGGQPWKSSLCR